MTIRMGARFETALLVQSILMIVAQLALLELCIRIEYAYEGSYMSDGRNVFVKLTGNIQQAVSTSSSRLQVVLGMD